jgi:biopolymer transport protein ExbD
MAIPRIITGSDKSMRYVPPRRRRERARAKMQLPLTPMIDVTFQLLLFFLLATTFRQAEGQISATLPQQHAASALDQAIVKPIRISILPAGQDGQAIYHIAGMAAPLNNPQELYGELAARRQAYGSDEVPVALQPRWDVPWQYVIEADNQAHRAGFKAIGIVSVP